VKKNQTSKPMHRAVVFCNRIKESEEITKRFQSVVKAYQEYKKEDNPLTCELRHVDGTQSANQRGKDISWLGDATEPDECRILSNARCLSEGVDVPALDAIFFLHHQKSHIDVVKAVGRVMRKAEGKKKGYVILPVGVPAVPKLKKALDKNKKYKVIWQVVNALCAHDRGLSRIIENARLSAGQGFEGKIASLALVGR
ncbi:MAG: helicase-related protein, partial [Cytophagales bacterium]|nr:helicase-related protein [Cytophagales bacterium]